MHGARLNKFKPGRLRMFKLDGPSLFKHVETFPAKVWLMFTSGVKGTSGCLHVSKDNNEDPLRSMIGSLLGFVARPLTRAGRLPGWTRGMRVVLVEHTLLERTETRFYGAQSREPGLPSDRDQRYAKEVWLQKWVTSSKMVAF